MTEQYKIVTYEACNKLNCNECGDEVILCLNPVFTLNGAPYIEALLSKDVQPITREGRRLYRYSFSYDPADLAELSQDAGISSCDIRAATCKGCATSYMEWLSSQAALVGVQGITETDEQGIINLSDPHNPIFSFPAPHTSLFRSPTDLVATLQENDDANLYVDPKDTFIPDLVSLGYDLVNPSPLRAASIKVTGKALVSFINASVSRQQNCFMEAFILIDDVEIDDSRIDYTLTSIISTGSIDFLLFPTWVFSLANAATKNIKVGVRVKRVHGADPADLSSLRIEDRSVQVYEIFGNTI